MPVPTRIAIGTFFTAEDHGSVILIRPLTKEAREYLEDLVGQTEAWQWQGGALAVEPRYACELLLALREM